MRGGKTHVADKGFVCKKIPSVKAIVVDGWMEAPGSIYIVAQPRRGKEGPFFFFER